MIAALSLIVGWFVLMGSYVIVMHAKRVQDEGGKLSPLWLISIVPWAVIGLALDVAFNLVAGTIMFVELPREWLFTTRAERHFRNSDGWRLKLAQWWAVTLNTFDKTHITPPKG